MKSLRSPIINLYKLSRILICALIPALLLGSCASQRQSHEPGILRVNLGAEPPGLDWATYTDSTSFDVVSNLMTGLTMYTPDLKAAPACAKSWEVLDGGRRYVFHLRQDVKWTDGKPCVAGDFEYSWKRLLEPKTAASYAYFLYDIVNALEFNTGKINDASKVGIKALDDHTLEVRLKTPAAYFTYLTAFCPTLPQRKDVVEKWGDRWTEPEHMITNGPFMLTHWQHEYKIELTGNPHYFLGAPKLEKIKMFMIPEQSTAFALYENDELDYVDNRSFSTPDVERYKDSKEYHCTPLLRNNYVGFNVHKKPFDDARVRRAFSMAIDRSTFPRMLRRNEEPVATWLPPALPGYAKSSGLKFDPAEAQRLLAEAGYPDGKGFPRVELLYPNRDDTTVVVQDLQDQFSRNLHVKIGLQNTEWKVYLATVHQDAPPIFRANWGADYPDPETFMNLFTAHSGNNYTKWNNPQYDKLIHAAEGEQDSAKRAALYQKADYILSSVDCPIAPTYLATQNTMVKPWVKGMAFNPLDMTFFDEVSVE